MVQLSPTIVGALIGALAGAFGTAVTLGIPMWRFMSDVRDEARAAHRLLSGAEETEAAGVLPRLRALEEVAEEHERELTRIGFSREFDRVDPGAGRERSEGRGD